jgi:hypothetical protein
VLTRSRATWTRDLRLYRSATEWWTRAGEGEHPPGTGSVHAQSRFRSVADPDRFALYSVRHLPAGTAPAPVDHTLAVVREFRRVPLEASTLGLALFVAQPGRTARILAILADWAERAVSQYQPGYLLLAHSLEDLRVTALLAGVHEARALQQLTPRAFSVDLVLPELENLLDAGPEWYAYCEDGAGAGPSCTVSPRAV